MLNEKKVIEKKLVREEAGKGKSQGPKRKVGHGAGVRMGNLWWM